MLTDNSNREIRRLAPYVRVSKREQAEEGLSPGTQIRRMRQWAESRDLHVVEVYQDLGWSGALGYDDTKGQYRPGLAQLVADIEADEIDAVVVYRLDRIFRSPAICVRFLDEVVLPRDVPLISVMEGLDSSTPYGRMAMQLLSVVAGYFLEWMSENIADNLQRMLEEGHPMGIAPFGWEYSDVPGSDHRRLVRVEEDGRWLMMMREMFMSGHSIASIGRRLHDNCVRSPEGNEHWNETVIRKLLQNPKHAGHQYTRSGELTMATHHDDRYWELPDHHRINELFERRTQLSATTASDPTYLLSGLLRCAHCGQRLYGRRMRDRIRRPYRCCSHRGEQTPQCSANSKPADVLENCVISMLREISHSEQVQRLAAAHAEEMVDEQDADLAARRDELRQRLEKTRADLARWNQTWHDDPEMDREQFHTESRRLNERGERLQEQLEAVQAQLDRRQSRLDRLAEVQGLLQDFDALWEGMDLEERRHAIHTVIRDATLEHHEDGTATLRVVPCFMQERSFAIPHLHGTVDVGDGQLTLRQLALLKLRDEGLDRRQIARRWGVKVTTVHGTVHEIRKRLNVDLDEAAALAADAINRYDHALPLSGRSQRDDTSEDGSVITDTQRKVLELVLEGHTAPKIAQLLDIGSVNTVYVHLHHARERLGAPTDLAAAEKARYLGLLGDEGAGTLPTMSPRELALLQHVADGRSLDEVADLWQTTRDNVRNVADSILGKLDEDDLAQAAEVMREQIQAHLPRLPLRGRVFELPDDEPRVSPLQRRILMLVGKGLTYGEIGERVGRAVPTVGYHLTRMRKMFDVHTSEEAAEAAHELELL